MPPPSAAVSEYQFGVFSVDVRACELRKHGTRIKLQERPLRLLVALLDQAMTLGAKYATLEVRPSNIVAQNLYRKYQFREQGRKRRYYSDNGEDALIMVAGPLDQQECKEIFGNDPLLENSPTASRFNIGGVLRPLKRPQDDS